ncbi:MAG: molybdopterin-dependent oxidoreductase [Gammaproteobacteria bacterium]|jgi:hypothetical protein|nr:molybdopterin-dependent oxidoreductase [Gammaproteobacteria bacterium]MBT3722545.1 molybdopterin-dependent oxidoreductase [Gammaproteobacteria bacterium]MBT4076727.1 molybdopterin-dependent oxidoreductase [Gammaproteobacteria bacterium]MBT4196251.1 molybdopterin-dependent oxidoreductase [Gammaproteobacteria bacterium]MBT4449510.1 molybdopterin-dependent oxidoreductase [Gammaproteobacteria bacterium]
MKSLITIIFFIFSPVIYADNFTSKNEPVLTITGNIQGDNGSQTIDFNIAMLETMPSHTLHTETTWTSGIQTFKGVLIKTLLDSISSTGQTLTAHALNDFQIDIPVSDIEQYPVIIAYQQNGKYMAIRNKGPLWIIYPESDFPELNRPSIKNRWIWQLKEIKVQ